MVGVGKLRITGQLKPPVSFINNGTQTYTGLCSVYGYFLAIRAGLNAFNREHMTCQVWGLSAAT